MTLTELADCYFHVKVLRAKTIETYRECVSAFVKHLGRDPDLRDLTPDDFFRFRDAHLHRNQRETFNLRRRHLACLIRFAVEEEMLAMNPVRRIKRIPVPQRSPRALSEESVSAALNVVERETPRGLKGKFAPQWFWRCLLQTLYFTGMRRAQVLGLRWSDIDLEVKTIRLRAETSKNWREWRIPLSAGLEPYIRELHDQTVRVRGRIDPNGQVFCLPIFVPRWFKRPELTNWRLSAFFTRLSGAVRQELNASDVRVSAHRYRHTAATLLVRRTGGNIKIVQSILGHVDAKSTLVYVGADLSDMREALNRL